MIQTDSPSEATPPSNEGLNVLGSLQNLPAVKEGFLWDYAHHRGLNTLGLEVVSWKSLGLDLTWIGTDGVGATLDYSLSALPVQNVPILSYVQYLNLGYAVGYRTLALGDVTDNPKSDNQFIHGPVIFVKLKF